MRRMLLAAWALALAPFAVASAQDDLPGSYYYRETVKENARGIRAKGVLPETVTTDPTRVTKKILTAADEAKRGSQDVPAYFLGATGPKGQDVQAGLAWARVKDAKGNLLWTDHASGSDMGNKANQIVLKAAAAAGSKLTALVGDDETVWDVMDAATNKPVTDLNALDGIKVNFV